MKRCSQKRCCLFYALHLLFVWLGFIATAEMCSNTYLVFVLTAFVSCCRHAQGDWSELRAAPKRSRRQVHRLFWVHIGSRCTCRCCRPSASGAKGAGGTRLECERSWQDLQSRYRFVSVSVFFSCDVTVCLESNKRAHVEPQHQNSFGASRLTRALACALHLRYRHRW